MEQKQCPRGTSDYDRPSSIAILRQSKKQNIEVFTSQK